MAIQKQFQKYITHLERTRAVETAKTYRYSLLRFAEFLGERLPTPDLAEEFLLTLNGNSPASVIRHLSTIRSFFKFCKVEFFYESPHRPRRLPKYITEEQFQVLFKKAHEQDVRTMVTVLFGGGLRISELVGLADEDVSEDYIKVRGKGDKERLIPLEKPIMDEIQKWQGVKRNSTWLFPGGRRDTHITKECAQGKIKALLKLCGMGGYSAHAFRHGALTSLHERGADLRLIQEFAGHSDISTTAKYIHLSPQTLQNKLPKRFEDASPTKTA